MIKFVYFSVVCLQTLHLALCPTDPQEERANLGDDVTLQCQDPRDEAVKLLEWIRPDLESEGYVFIFRDNRTYEKYQHLSFYDRVELKDSQMKHGDFSVILMDVTINDTGTYKCHVRYESRSEFIRIINLTVTDSGGDKDGHAGLAVGLTVPVLLLVVFVVVVGFLIYRKRKEQSKQNLIHPPPNEASDKQAMINVLVCESD